jgi:1-acyl-sn-glycerol-3-phosphate acyltransferase
VACYHSAYEVDEFRGEARLEGSLVSASWYAVLRRLARSLIPLQARFTFSHAERLPQSGGVLLISNHLGPSDPIFIGVRLNREMHILAKAELFEYPLLGWIARRCGAVPVHRGESDREALRSALKLLSAERCVLIFPEGAYAKPPLPPAMLPFKSGAAWLALRADVPILPVAIIGSEWIWTVRRGWRMWRYPHVHVTFGEPYRPRVPEGVSTREALRVIADEMASRIAALLPDVYRGRYCSAAGMDGRSSPDDAALPAGVLPLAP